MTPLEFLLEAKRHGLKVPAELLCFGFTRTHGLAPTVDQAKGLGLSRSRYYEVLKRLPLVSEVPESRVPDSHDHDHALSKREENMFSPSNEGHDHGSSQVPESRPQDAPSRADLLQLQQELLAHGIGKKRRNPLVPVKLDDPDTYFIDYGPIRYVLELRGYAAVRQALDYYVERQNRGETFEKGLAAALYWALKHGKNILPPPGYWEAKQEALAVPDADTELSPAIPEPVLSERERSHREHIVSTIRDLVQTLTNEGKKLPSFLQIQIRDAIQEFNLTPQDLGLRSGYAV